MFLGLGNFVSQASPTVGEAEELASALGHLLRDSEAILFKPPKYKASAGFVFGRQTKTLGGGGFTLGGLYNLNGP